MHELYLIQSMINQISLNAAERGVYRVHRIHLINGQLSGGNTESLRFAFSLFKDTPLFQDAVLEVEEPELIGLCNSCDQTFKIEESQFICSYCSKGNIELINGQELYIDYYEGD